MRHTTSEHGIDSATAGVEATKVALHGQPEQFRRDETSSSESPVPYRLRENHPREMCPRKDVRVPEPCVLIHTTNSLPKTLGRSSPEKLLKMARKVVRSLSETFSKQVFKQDKVYSRRIRPA
jgi:hypothetical protein